MKAIIVALLLITTLSVKLDLSTNAVINDLNNFFTLSSQQAQGTVTYSCQGLPQGFVISGNQLTYTGNVGLQGQFPVRITATDSNGQTDTQVVLLNVNLSGKGSITYSSAASQQSVNTVLTTISQVSNSSAPSVTAGSSSSSSSSITSSTSSSSSSSSSSTASSGSTSATSSSQPSSGAQILSVNGVNYNFGNSLSLNLNANTGGINIGSTSPTTSTTDINTLVSQYGQTTTTSSSTSSGSTTTSQTITSYPSVIVTGNLPNAVPNTQILQISTGQSALGNQAINPLSEYDRNITDLFNQQTQISQTIANLLEIIRQQTANRQKAQTDVNTYTASLNTAVNSQQQISLTITQE